MNLPVHHEKEPQIKKEPDSDKDGLHGDHITNGDCELEKRKNISIENKIQEKEDSQGFTTWDFLGAGEPVGEPLGCRMHF